MKKWITPIDWVAYNHLYLKKGLDWIEQHPEVCQRYLSRFWQLNFDMPSLKRRFVDYFKMRNNAKRTITRSQEGN
jgi:hypothetical protein